MLFPFLAGDIWSLAAGTSVPHLQLPWPSLEGYPQGGCQGQEGKYQGGRERRGSGDGGGGRGRVDQAREGSRDQGGA